MFKADVNGLILTVLKYVRSKRHSSMCKIVTVLTLVCFILPWLI